MNLTVQEDLKIYGRNTNPKVATKNAGFENNKIEKKVVTSKFPVVTTFQVATKIFMLRPEVQNSIE